MRFTRLVVVFALLLGTSCVASAQTAPNLSNGIPPQGSYDGSSVDTVNLMNGNLTLHIPLPIAYPQRGKLGIQYYLVVNAKTWSAALSTLTGQNQWSPTSACTIVDNPSSGPCGQGPVFVSTASFGTRSYLQVSTDGAPTDYGVSDPGGISTWDGSSHGLIATSVSGTFMATDTSGYKVVLSGSDINGLAYNAVVIDRNDTQYSGSFSHDLSTCATTTSYGWPTFQGSTRSVSCSEHFIVSSITDVNGNVLTPPLGVPDIAVPKANGPTTLRPAVTRPARGAYAALPMIRSPGCSRPKTPSRGPSLTPTTQTVSCCRRPRLRPTRRVRPRRRSASAMTRCIV